jgi:hypothetical protein
VPKPRFDYHEFLTKLELNTFKTLSALIVISWLFNHALKEIRPTLEYLWQFFHSP